MRTTLVAMLLLCLAAGAAAQDLLQAALREEIVLVRHPAGVELETTLFRPPGDGPFPLVVVNHGKALGDPRAQGRARYLVVARELVRRGYAVVAPMRQGFSRSGGQYEPHPCDAETNGRHQAEDVHATIAAYAQRPDIDATRVVVLGQSHGGLTTLALGTMAVPGVVGLVNFAGGLREDSCADWRSGLVRAVGRYGRHSRVPSLWIYGDNDTLFETALWRDMHRQYTDAGGRATLLAHGRFGDDAHELLGQRAGVAVWLPALERFFVALGLPFDPRHDLDIDDGEE